MNKSPQYNQQTEPKQRKPEVDEICIYQNLGSGHHNIYIYLKMKSGFHVRKNPKQQYQKVVMFSDALFIKKRIYVYDNAA